MILRAIFGLVLFISISSSANDSTKLYNPKANAGKDVAEALVQAKKQGKHVFLQVGGNWCVWCYKFNSFVQLDTSLKKILNENYIVYHLNFSKENKNLDYMKKLGYPQRFGFPVMVILDADGNRLHTQNSALLEKGNGYDFDKVKDFLLNWAPSAFNPSLYKD